MPKSETSTTAPPTAPLSDTEDFERELRKLSPPTDYYDALKRAGVDVILVNSLAYSIAKAVVLLGDIRRQIGARVSDSKLPTPKESA